MDFSFPCARSCCLVLIVWQELDTRTINRLEKAVSKSEFSQGKKLKVVPKVQSLLYPFSSVQQLMKSTGQP